jgi:uncharacterized CHY-type Zn-finger protein
MREFKAVRDAQILERYYLGEYNSQIAISVGCSVCVVDGLLRKFKLHRNHKNQSKLRVVDKNTVVCGRCNRHLTIDRFYTKGGKFQYSFCKDCRYATRKENINRDPEKYFRYTCSNKRAAAKRIGVSFSLTPGQLRRIYENQGGLCFYTDAQMLTALGSGMKPNSLSIDRINPRRGYHKRNIVLCCRRINAVKSDLSMEELKEWMPGWYRRLQKVL